MLFVKRKGNPEYLRENLKSIVSKVVFIYLRR
jgi:hypothetical protein